uniref:IL27B N-terminal Fn3 domain-containing protein n=1 Tax=Cairina moschata TaxID=8855 RepID=A0A8C3CKJ2_CAIMO
KIKTNPRGKQTRLREKGGCKRSLKAVRRQKSLSLSPDPRRDAGGRCPPRCPGASRAPGAGGRAVRPGGAELREPVREPGADRRHRKRPGEAAEDWQRPAPIVQRRRRDRTARCRPEQPAAGSPPPVPLVPVPAPVPVPVRRAPWTHSRGGAQEDAQSHPRPGQGDGVPRGSPGVSFPRRPRGLGRGSSLVQWRREGAAALPEGSAVHQGALVLPHASLAAAGTYSCHGEDGSLLHTVSLRLGHLPGVPFVSCRASDYENFSCSWTSSLETFLPTRYITTYRKKSLTGEEKRRNKSGHVGPCLQDPSRAGTCTVHRSEFWSSYRLNITEVNPLGSSFRLLDITMQAIIKPDPPEGLVVEPVPLAPRRLYVSWKYPASWPKEPHFQLRFRLQYRPVIHRSWSVVSGGRGGARRGGAGVGTAASGFGGAHVPDVSRCPGGDGEPVRGDHGRLRGAGARGASEREGFPGRGELERVERGGTGHAGQRCGAGVLTVPPTAPSPCHPPPSSVTRARPSSWGPFTLPRTTQKLAPRWEVELQGGKAAPTSCCPMTGCTLGAVPQGSQGKVELPGAPQGHPWAPRPQRQPSLLLPAMLPLVLGD